MTVLVGPVAALAAFKVSAPKIIANAQRREITFGDPLMEDAGVPNRRFAIAHPFNADEIAWITARLPASCTLLTALPADWRRQTGTGGQ